MLKRLGIDLQTHVDTIHHAAVEILREAPDPQTIAAGRRATDVVIEYGSHSPQTWAVVRVARLAQDAFQRVMRLNGQGKARSGHLVAAIVADLGRTVDAIESGNDPTPFVAHAESLAGSIPQPDDENNLVEIDLNDREQLLRLVAQHSATPLDPEVPPVVNLVAIDDALATLGWFAEQLLERDEDTETIDGLVNALVDLQDLAARFQIEHIGRVVASALRVVESHRLSGELLPLDAIEFVVACWRVIPIILDSLDDPGRVSHAVDALVDQSAFVLLELRRGTSPLSDLWPEPDPAEYRSIGSRRTTTTLAEEPEEPEPIQDETGLLLGWDVEEYRPASSALLGPGPGTAALSRDRSEVRVPIEQIEQLIELAGELSIRSGGLSQRSRRVLSVSQDMNSIADRLRYLLRNWQDGKYTDEQVEQLLSEISADLILASGDLEHARSDYLSTSERQADVRNRLEETISALRSIPLMEVMRTLEASFDDLAMSYGKRARLNIEGASTVVDAVHAEQMTEMFRHLIVNALEHGIENPNDRVRGEKKPVGLVRIRARRDGSQTVIQIIDDGAGMEQQTILDRAEAAGYPVPRHDMTRERVLQYIFLPGFTTKVPQTGIEYGMGLDYVTDVVSRMGGVISVQSEPGRGTAFTIRVPVASMTLPATIVAISSERYALPAAAIEPVAAELIDEIEETADGYCAVIGGLSLPAADLGAMLGIRSHHHVQSEHGSFIRVRYDEDEDWLLRVDRVIENESISLQPMEREHAHLYGVVGMTRLLTGEDALVLDIMQLVDVASRRIRRLTRQTASLSRVPFALVSDDSISIRRQISAHLEQSGWRVVEARDAFETRELLENVAPDLIVVDLDLPAHGGFQVVQSSRSLENVPALIGLTARDESEIREWLESFQIDECLSKPLDFDQFDRAMERAARASIPDD